MGERAYNSQTGEWAEWDGSAWRIIPPASPPGVDDGSGIVATQPNEQRLPRAVNPKTGQAVVLRDGQWVPESLKAELRNRSGQALSGLTTGFSGLMSLPGTARELTNVAADFASDKARDLWNRNVAGTGLEVGPTRKESRTGREPATIIPTFNQTESFISNLPTKVGAEPLPTVRSVAEGKNAGVEKPNDFVGRALQSTGEMVGASPFPGMLGMNLVGGLSGAGLETLFPDWRWARAVGQFLGAGGYGVAKSLMSTPAKVAKDATEHFGPDDWERAAQLQQRAKDQGVNLFAHEALATSPSDPVAVMAGNVRANPQGGRVIEGALQERVPQMRSAAENVVATVGDKVDDPIGVGIRAQAAADKALAAPKIDRANAAKTYFDRARAATVPQAITDDIVRQIDTAAASANPEGPIAKLFSDIKSRVVAAKGNVGQIDEVLKVYDDVLKANAFEAGSPIGETIRVNVKPVLGSIRDTLKNNVDDYARGMEIYSGRPDLGPSMYTSEVKRAEQSALTPLADSTPGLPVAKRFESLVMNPDNARPEAVKFTIRSLSKQDPQAATQAVRLYLENSLDDAFRRLQGGPNPASGANFANAVGATEQQRANLFAALDALPVNGKAVSGRSAGFKNLLEVLEKTGVTPGLGSPTAGRSVMNAQMASGGMLDTALSAANLPQGSFVRPLQDWWRNISMGKNYRELATILTSEDSVAKLQQLAILNPSSAKARLVATELLTGARAAETAGPVTLP